MQHVEGSGTPVLYIGYKHNNMNGAKVKTVQHVSSILMPIIRSLSTARAASGLPLGRGGSSVVGRGRAVGPAGPTPTNNPATTTPQR
jgi:hypothetical protein